MKLGNRYGYIDRSGEAVIAVPFESASDFSEGLAAVMLTGIGPLHTRRAEGFRNGWAEVETADGKQGYVERSGR